MKIVRFALSHCKAYPHLFVVVLITGIKIVLANLMNLMTDPIAGLVKVSFGLK